MIFFYWVKNSKSFVFDWNLKIYFWFLFFLLVVALSFSSSSDDVRLYLNKIKISLCNAIQKQWITIYLEREREIIYIYICLWSSLFFRFRLVVLADTWVLSGKANRDGVPNFFLHLWKRQHFFPNWHSSRSYIIWYRL